MNQPQIPQHIYREAERRFARQLSADFPPAERAALNRWLDEAPEHRLAYETAQQTWNELGSLRDDPAITAMRARAAALAQASQRRRRRNRQFAAIAACLTVAVLWGGLQTPWGEKAGGQWFGGHALQTAVGEHRTATLADGSTVTLNTGTRVETHLDGKVREVILDHGEALFAVHPDATRPFVVAVGRKDTVTALGTQFTVRHDDDKNRAIVTLLHGSVRIARGDGQVRVLKPGEQATLTAQGGIEVSRVDLDEATSWSRGWLRFRDESLGEVVNEVNRYAKQPIRLASPDLANMRVSGNFRVGDSASMAAAMTTILPLSVGKADGALVLHEARRGNAQITSNHRTD